MNYLFPGLLSTWKIHYDTLLVQHSQLAKPTLLLFTSTIHYIMPYLETIYVCAVNQSLHSSDAKKKKTERRYILHIYRPAGRLDPRTALSI